MPRTDTLRAGGQEGFTLLEVLVALAVLGLALVMIFQLFSSGLRTVGASDEYAAAVVRAEAAMREILEDDDIAEKSWSETTKEGYRINASVAKTAEERTENLTVRLLQVSLTLHWTSGQNERTITLKSQKLVNRKI